MTTIRRYTLEIHENCPCHDCQAVDPSHKAAGVVHEIENSVNGTPCEGLAHKPFGLGDAEPKNSRGAIEAIMGMNRDVSDKDLDYDHIAALVHKGATADNISMLSGEDWQAFVVYAFQCMMEPTLRWKDNSHLRVPRIVKVPDYGMGIMFEDLAVVPAIMEAE